VNRGFVVGFGIVLLALGAGAWAVYRALDPDHLRPVAERQLSTLLRMPVHIGRLSVRFLPVPVLEGRDIDIGGAAHDAPPSLSVATVRLTPRLSTVLSSVIVIESIELGGVHVNVLRDADGRWALPGPSHFTAGAPRTRGTATPAREAGAADASGSAQGTMVSVSAFRLADGTFARNRPLPNTLWLDDMYMSLPAIAQMGVLTGDKKYYDEAVKQFRLFTGRMFNKEKGLYMHGWVQDMNPHPQFHWARANGWAFMTMVELLDALPENYEGRNEVLDVFKQHAAGLARLQDRTGFWHQLLDKNDSYLETSATAIYTYCIARAINKGWLDAKAYGPMVVLAWNAVTTNVNKEGQVEGTCVGTGMGFDPAFYYYRPVNKYAAHGYGPVLLAGAEMYRMLQLHPFKINDSAAQVEK